MRKGIRENCPAAEAAGLLINLRTIDESNYEFSDCVEDGYVFMRITL